MLEHRMRPLAARLVAAFLALMLAAAPGVSAPIARPHLASWAAVVTPAKVAPARVILLRGGVGGVFSHGLDAIAAALSVHGIPATVRGYGSARALSRQIISEAKAAGTPPRLVLIGHSFGADAVTAIAADLERAGIRVDLLVSFAATAPRPVSKNVRRALNYYFAKGGWGLPLRAARGFRGRLDNRDYSAVAGVGHFNIEKQKSVQDEVIAAVVAAARR